MSFAEQYPQCATCPFLGDLQERKDLHLQKIRDAESETLDWGLTGILQESQTQITAEQIVDLLDKIHQLEISGNLPASALADREALLQHFASLNEETNGLQGDIKQRIAAHDEYATMIQDILGDYDLAASLYADNCEIPTEISPLVGRFACYSLAQQERPEIIT